MARTKETSPTPGANDTRPDQDTTEEDLAALLDACRIVIRPNGEVVFENLSPAMLDVALALNPEAPSLHCRLDTIDKCGAGNDSGRDDA